MFSKKSEEEIEKPAPAKKSMNRTLDPRDYASFSKSLTGLWDAHQTGEFIINHPHRRWEYLSALDCLARFEDKQERRVLDVGSGGSPFPVMLKKLGYDVTVVDPSGEANRLRGHVNNVQRLDFLEWEPTFKPTASFAISVLEHVKDDEAFVEKLMDITGSLIFLTVDFHASGKAFVPHHLRTYSADRLRELAGMGKEWELLGAPDWTDRGEQVGAYNFAALALVRK